MTAIQFLAEWAIRSSILILGGTLLLWVLRVRDASLRLAACTLLLCASLAIPMLTRALPNLPFQAMPKASETVTSPIGVSAPLPRPAGSVPDSVPSARFDWMGAVLLAYAAGVLILLGRLTVGLAMSLRLLRGSRATEQSSEGIKILESDRVGAPVTLGILRPAILLPADWRAWETEKLDAVLAHERSHIGRRDPAVQLFSALHRALLWHSPLSWFLHRRIIRIAEEASDDAAIAVIRDRALYARFLMDFMLHGIRGAKLPGVAMARYGLPEKRLNRILDSNALSPGLTRSGLAALLAFGLPLVYFTAAAEPVRAFAPQPVKPIVAPAVAQTAPHPAPATRPERAPAYLTGLGNVTPFYTVTVKSRVDGQLMSVSVREGDSVREGQLLAAIDSRPYQLLLDEAEGNLARAELDFKRGLAGAGPSAAPELQTARAKVEYAKLQLSYTTIASPISGVAGLRLVDPGNIVHAADPNGILIVTQLHPIAVLFNVPEDFVAQIRARLRQTAAIPVEAWDRTNSKRLATGHLTAIDNLIDPETGTAKLKAVFDNNADALFPNQFVNVHLFMNDQ